MKQFTYIGSTKENHGKLIVLAWQFGLQNIRKMTIGDAIAKKANEGIEKYIAACENNPEFFAEV